MFKLDNLLINYPVTLRKKIILGFTYGFSIHYDGPRNSRVYHNHKSANENPSAVLDIVMNEISVNRVAGPFTSPPFDNFIVSPLALVPKKSPGEFRLIHNLSYPIGDSINSHIPVEHSSVHYESFSDFTKIVKRCGTSCYIAKSDIQKAFRLLPIRPIDYPLLGFKLGSSWYYDRCLPMGCSVSCQTFELFSSALKWILSARYGISDVWHLIDDFVFVAKEATECDSYLHSFLNLAKELAIPINTSKTFKSSTTMTVHGIEIDTVSMITRLPLDKLLRLRQLLVDFSKKRKATLREIQSVVGLLNFACMVVVPGRPFLRRLINLTRGVSAPHHHIRISKEARKDIAAWRIFADSFNGRSLLLEDRWINSKNISLFTDASGSMGYAAVFGPAWFNGVWPRTWSNYHITIKELYPIVAALEFWSDQLSNKCINLMTDNQAVVDIINNQTSKDNICMILVRRLVIVCLSYNILFHATHIPGVTNVIADSLSRFQVLRARHRAPWLSQFPCKLPVSILPWTVL